MKRQEVHFLWNEPQITKGFDSAVSLHSHTNRSREGLGLVPRYAEDYPLIGFAVARISSSYRKLAGRALDFQRAYFAPPLAPLEAYRVEARQIEALDLKPMVSITDHDSIEAPRLLQPFVDPDTVPVSLEWSLPFGESLFHVGIHNLPKERADSIVNLLGEVQCAFCRTAQVACVGTHDARCLPNVRELMEYLASIPDTLTVLNHPFWDVSGRGEFRHKDLLKLFLAQYSPWIHALELNGLRTWNENRDVIALAKNWRLPVISGGDRHGHEPNAVINLTTARTFAQFAWQIRDKESSVLFLPQYQRPLMLRKLQVGWEVLKTSTGINGTQGWKDRVFLPWIDGRVLPLSSREWSGTLANESIVRPHPAECLPCDVLQGTEH
jgi:hypothetical protein